MSAPARQFAEEILTVADLTEGKSVWSKSGLRSEIRNVREGSTPDRIRFDIVDPRTGLVAAEIEGGADLVYSSFPETEDSIQAYAEWFVGRTS